MVITEEVEVTPQDICEFYNVPYYANHFLDIIDLDTFKDIEMDVIVKYLTQGRGIWNHKSDTKIPTNLNEAIMFPVAKIWM